MSDRRQRKGNKESPRSPRGNVKTHHFKLVLLGDASVGKSCLVVRFAKGEFYENQEPTIGGEFYLQYLTTYENPSRIAPYLWLQSDSGGVGLSVLTYL